MIREVVAAAVNLPWKGIITATVIGAIIGGDPSNSLNEFAYRWQTGIAAAIAAVAAYITVSKMQYVDDRAQRRHEELTAVQLREDRLLLDHAVDRVRRTTFFAPERIKTAADKVADYLDAALRTQRPLANNTFGEEAENSLRNARLAADRWSEEIVEVWKVWGSPEVHEAQRLFGPVFMREIAEFRAAVSRVRPSFAMRNPNSTISDGAYPDFLTLPASDAVAVIQNVRLLSQTIVHMVERLDARLLTLRDAYPRIIDAT